MSIIKETFITPVSRLVLGSLYNPQTTDAEGKPLIVKKGKNAGQPGVKFFFAIAIPKQGEQHWSQTTWGEKIHRIGHTSFPQGQASSPSFAWKIKDGDDRTPNKKGFVEADREGYAGCWILHYTSGIAPKIWHVREKRYIEEKNYINLGDYVEVNTEVQGNSSPNQPGIFLQGNIGCALAFIGYGQRISMNTNPEDMGFGQQQAPAGCSTMPPAGSLPPVQTPVSSTPQYQTPLPPIVPQSVPAPHYGILNPPAPPVASIPPMPAAPAMPQKVMTAKAAGGTYEQYVAQGWTDAALISEGFMTIV